MRRCLPVLVGVVLAVGCGAGLAAGRPPARMMVYAQEWSLWASRTSVPAGQVTVTLWNRGQDAHDLAVRPLGRVRGAVSAGAVASVASGGMTNVSWRLVPGRYELLCTLPGHRARGMRTVLVVR